MLELAAGRRNFGAERKYVDHMSEELKLLARARAMEPGALEEIHKTYYTPIFRYVAQKVSNTQLAEDLTGEVFVRLLDALQDKNAPSNTLRGWLYGVASRVVKDHYRKVYRHRRYEEKQNPETFVANIRSDVERNVDLHEALTTLTPEQQDVLALRFGSGLKIRDVAKTLGKSEGAIKQLQARALRSLAKELEGQKT